MPLYEHRCESCKRIHDFFRPVSQAATEERCPICDGETSRVYSYSTPKEFTPYYDQKFKCEIRTDGQERKQMKKHKQVYTRDALTAFRGQQQIKQILDKKKFDMKRGIGV